MNPIPFSRRDAAEERRLPASATSPSPAFRPWAAEKANPLAPKKPHFPPRAKHVIFLCMEGAPSHVDTFDYKPKLRRTERQEHAACRVALAASCSPRRGSSPSTARAACGSPSCSPNWPSRPTICACFAACTPTCRPIAQAFLQMHTGISQFKRPSMGAWTFYGLGTENENLPGFITISPPLPERRPVQLRQRLPAGRVPGHAHPHRLWRLRRLWRWRGRWRQCEQHPQPAPVDRGAADAARFHPVAQPRHAGARAA